MNFPQQEGAVLSNRIDGIDIAKGIGMALVVLGHLTPRTQVLRILAYSFHMPLFFILSGYFYNEKKPVSLSIKKDFHKLILPAYGVLLFDSLVSVIKSVFDKAAWPTLIDWMEGIILYEGVLWNSPVWFLLTLFLCKNIFLLCSRIHKSLPYVIMSIFVIACSLNLNMFLPSWGGINIIMAFPFFAAGVILKHLNYKQPGILVNLILTVTWVLASIYNGYTDIHIQMNGNNYLIFLFTGIAGSYLCVALSTLISKISLGSFLKKLGADSFIILLTHYYICRGIVPKILKRIDVQSNIYIQIGLTGIIVTLYYFCLMFKDHVHQTLHH